MQLKIYIESHITNLGLIKPAAYLAWTRISSEYSGARLGFIWEPISILFVVTFLSIVWGQVLDSASALDYFFYVLSGFVVWGLMSRAIDQCLSFKGRTQQALRRGSMKLWGHIVSDIFYCYSQFMLTFPFALVACALMYGVSFSSLVTLAIVLICICLTSYGLLSSLAVATVFFDDLTRLVRMFMRVAFLVTPVLWKPDMLGDKGQVIIYLNPFFSYLDVFRSSLMGGGVSNASLGVMIFTTIVIYSLGFYVFGKFENSLLNEIFLDKNV